MVCLRLQNSTHHSVWHLVITHNKRDGSKEGGQRREKKLECIFHRKSLLFSLQGSHWDYMRRGRCRKYKQHHIAGSKHTLIFKADLEEPGLFPLPITFYRIHLLIIRFFKPSTVDLKNNILRVVGALGRFCSWLHRC